MKSTKLKIIMSVIATFCIIAFAISISYGYMYYTNTQDQANVIDTACYDITYSNESDSITLAYRYPISDAKALEQTPYTITLTNNCDKAVTYKVNLNIMNESTTNDSYIKVGVNNEVTSLTDLTSMDATVSGADHAYNIKTAGLAAGQTLTLNIRSWMDETVSGGQNTNFINKVHVEIESQNTSKNLATAILNSNELHTTAPTAAQFQAGEPKSDGTSGSGSGLFSALDDDGDSYYLRGAITNNYVSFANKTWKVVRINGDGSVRLILNSKIGENIAFNDAGQTHKYVGYTYDNESKCIKGNPCISTYNSATQTFTNNKQVTNSTIKDYLENTWYKEIASYDTLISIGSYCNDTTKTGSGNPYYYGARNRGVNGNPSLNCTDTSESYGGFYKSKIGLISSDEAMLAGY